MSQDDSTLRRFMRSTNASRNRSSRSAVIIPAPTPKLVEETAAVVPNVDNISANEEAARLQILVNTADTLTLDILTFLRHHLQTRQRRDPRAKCSRNEVAIARRPGGSSPHSGKCISNSARYCGGQRRRTPQGLQGSSRIGYGSPSLIDAITCKTFEALQEWHHGVFELRWQAPTPANLSRTPDNLVVSNALSPFTLNQRMITRS
jgi:hypothetical protein